MQNGTSDGLRFHLTAFSSVERGCVCVCGADGKECSHACYVSVLGYF